jgi:hypothetical protein
MSAGRGYAGSGYYLKTDRGLWIRSLADYASGVITVEYQRRLVVDGGDGVLLDEEGNESERFSLSRDSVPEEWVLCSSISLDGPYHQFCLDVSRAIGCAVRDVHARTSMHAVILSALGWGGSIGDALGWFECGPICADECRYIVDSPGDELSGLDGAVVTVTTFEDSGLADPVQCSVSTPDGLFDFELSQSSVLMRMCPEI